MSWAEVKKINSDLSTPLNEILTNKDYGLPAIKSAILSSGGGGGTSKLIVTTNSTRMIGKEIICAVEDGEVVKAIFNENKKAELTLSFAGEYKLTSEFGDWNIPINIGTLGGIYYTEMNAAVINIENSYKDKATVNIVSENESFDIETNDNGTATTYFHYLGDYDLTCKENVATVTVSSLNNEMDVLVGLKFVAFADGTDNEIEKMLAAHYSGAINIADYWAIGDKRKVSLSAMPKTGVGESHVAQEQEFVIIGVNHDDLADGSGKAAITIQPLRMLSNGTTYERGYMNSSNTNSGGWEGCARRTWCNDVFINALPDWVKSSLKEVKKKNYKVYNSTTLTETTDKAFLLSETEIFGAKTYSAGNTEGVQYDYYKTSSNRIKYQGNATTTGSAYSWWERSPASSGSTYFCDVDSGGAADGTVASGTRGLAPALCL